MGGLDGAVAVRAERAIGEFLPEGEHELQRLLLQLVRSADGTPDTRRRVTVGELDDRTEQMVAVLTDARLLVAGRDPVSDNQTLEIAHEALIQSWQRLRGWIDANREFLVWRDRLTASLDGWRSGGEDPGTLLRGGPLVEAERWRNERGADLTVEERAFIDAGVEQRDAELQAEQRARQRLLRQLSVGLAVFAALAAIAVALAFQQAAAAENEREEAITASNAAEGARSVAERVTAEADAAQAEADRLGGEVEAAQAERDEALRARGEAVVAAANAPQLVAAAEAEVAAAERALDAARVDLATADASVEQALADAASTDVDRDAAEQEAETADQRRDEALTALGEAESALVAAERDAQAASDELQLLRSGIDAVCPGSPPLSDEILGLNVSSFFDNAELFVILQQLFVVRAC